MAMKLVIEIPLELNDLQEEDFNTVLREVNESESPHPACLGVQITRPVSEDETHIARVFELGAENFKVHVEQYETHSEKKQASIQRTVGGLYHEEVSTQE
jgi:hypothetical protein